jgi:anti-sigma B factor antagonist
LIACTLRVLQSAGVVAGCYGARHLVVDLAEVSFIDSTALGVLIGATKRLHSADGSFAVVCPSEKIGRVFEITGLDQVLAMHTSRDEALSAVPSG